MRPLLPGVLLLLLAPPAAAHFHGDLEVGRHDLGFRWEAGRVLVEERFEVRNAGSESFRGRVYAWLPPAANVTAFGLEGGPRDANGSGLVAFDLGPGGASLAPNATLDVTLQWSLPVPAGGALSRRLVYPTQDLRPHADAPLQVVRAPPAGLAGFGSEVVVQRAEEPALQGWHLFVAFAVLLAAGAWWWDRRRRPP